MTERQIKLEEVRVGDRIRVEWMERDILHAETATVANIGSYGGLISKEEWFIGPTYIQKRIRGGEPITITLLDRPKPKLPTEVGSVIHVSECRGEVCDTLAIFDNDGVWHTPIVVAGDYHHSPHHITAWEPRNVVEVQE